MAVTQEIQPDIKDAQLKQYLCNMYINKPYKPGMYENKTQKNETFKYKL